MAFLLCLHFICCFSLNNQVATTSILWLSWEPMEYASLFMNGWFSSAKQAVRTRFLAVRAKLDLLLNRRERPEKQQQHSDFAVLWNALEVSLGTHKGKKSTPENDVAWMARSSTCNAPSGCSVPRLSISRAKHHLPATHTSALKNMFI